MLAGRAAAPALALAVTLFSFALRHAVPLQAEGGAIHDDALFVRLATYVAEGNWLGPYDQLTLAKGAGYPVFIALASLAGVPLKMAEHAVYLSGCAALALAVARLFASRAAGIVCFVVIALNPVAWAPLQRVVREGLYIGLVTWIVALAALVSLVDREGGVEVEARRKWGRLLLLGLFGGVFWVTRDEGLWLAPSVLVLFLSWVWSARSRSRGMALVIGVAKVSAIPLAAFLAVVWAVEGANWRAYGAFVDSEFRSGEFRSAYGALARIEPKRWQRYVVAPSDARQAAYAVSPAARELAPTLEGPAGNAWRELGCAMSFVLPEACNEILGGMLMWALRDAAAAAGHYRSAAASRAYFERLGREVNEACDRGALACGPPRDTFVPRWHPELAAPLRASVLSVAHRLGTFRNLSVQPETSRGSPAQLEVFRRMTGARLAGADTGNTYGGPRLAAAKAIAAVQAALLPVALPAAIVAWVGALAWGIRQRRLHAGHALVAALHVGAAMRVGLLAFIDATSFPADDLLYLTPATPLALAIAPCVGFLVWVSIRR